MNFFSWIRDGVRQSVLLGVSDAVDQLGTPTTEEELHPSVTAFLSEKATTSGGPARIGNSSGKKTGGSRKRLGKSLKEIGTEEAA